MGGAVGVVATSAAAARETLLQYGKENQQKKHHLEPEWIFNENTLANLDEPAPGELCIWKLLHAMTLDDPAPPGVLFCEYYS